MRLRRCKRVYLYTHLAVLVATGCCRNRSPLPLLVSSSSDRTDDGQECDASYEKCTAYDDDASAKQPEDATLTPNGRAVAAGGHDGGVGGGSAGRTYLFDALASWLDGGVNYAGNFFSEHIYNDDKYDNDDNDSDNNNDDDEDDDDVEETETESGETGTKPSMGMFDQIKGAFSGIFDDNGNNDRRDQVGKDTGEQEKEGGKYPSSLAGLADLWSSAFSSRSDESVSNLIERARRFSNDVGVNETRTLQETFNLFSKAFGSVKEALDRNFGHIDIGRVSVPNLYYYLEHEDEVKNPSWRRRKHRFFKAVDPNQVYELHDALFLAEISYSDTVDQLKELLNGTKAQYELVYAKMESAPQEPAHFIAIKRRQKRWTNALEVLVSVRGTKQLGDFLSDAFLDNADYMGGKAHAGILQSGRYLAAKHTNLLRTLLEASGKKRTELVLVGHSLGAGAATIAAMEWNSNLPDSVDATVVGFGCPPVLSEELADSVKDYVLTVVADSDMVPRMSGATVGNAVLDIMAYDWTERALADVQQLIDVVRENVPFDLPRTKDENFLKFVNDTLKKMVISQLSDIPTERLRPVLLPPGRCVHFYRDGLAFTGRHTPCNFFDSIDITWTMIDDHLTHLGYHRALLSFIREYRGDFNFKFHHEPIF